MTLRSAPAQKTGRSCPAVFAQRMPTQTSGSSSSRSTDASRPTATSRLTALRASGRLRVMTPIRSEDEYRTASDIWMLLCMWAVTSHTYVAAAYTNWSVRQRCPEVGLVVNGTRWRDYEDSDRTWELGS